MARKLAKAKRANNANKKKKLLDEMESNKPVSSAKKTQVNQNGDFYKSGPMLNSPILNEKIKHKKPNQISSAALAEKKEEPLPTPSTSGKGKQSQDHAYADNIGLQGRTDATFDGGSFETQNVRVTRAEGCETCEAGQCIRVRGTLVARYRVTTTVTLPSVNDFPDLTRCQRERVQDAIDNVLAPHEQEHVRAFEQYNGVTRTPFDLTLCRSDFDSTIREMFEQQESGRREQGQNASDALDPFNFNVDLDCEDEENESSSTDESVSTEDEDKENTHKETETVKDEKEITAEDAANEASDPDKESEPKEKEEATQ